MSEADGLHRIEAPGFEGRDLGLRYLGWLGEPTLFMDGKPAEQIGRRREYRLIQNDGTEVPATVRARNFGIMAQVTIDERTYRVPSGLRWQHWLWAALPLLLFVFDRILGALLGAIAMVFSLYVLRSEKPWWKRFLVTLGINIGAVVLFIIIETMVVRLLT